MLRTTIFLVVSLGIIAVSWTSLRDWRSHGFFRFFAFECILLLVLLNVQRWFSEPLSPNQIISWILLVISLALAMHGFWILQVAGRPQGSFEKTTRLVKIGAYKFIRHPLYASLLALGWGVYLKDLSLIGGLIVLLMTGFLVATAKTEERENLERFGSEYSAYMDSTWLFIPYLF